MIAEMLGTGKGNARTAKKLAEMLGLRQREVSLLVEKERREGAPICATCDSKTPGYFLAENRAEMEVYCRQLWHRAGEIHKTRAACKKTLNSLPAE